jgi:DNA-binding response OmpR family regulator
MVSTLIIDHTTLGRKTIIESLKNFNLEFSEASDGASGLVMIAKTMPDIILLEVNLPDMDGFALLEKIKENANSSRTPVIIISSSSRSEDVEKALKLGAKYYLIKPIDASILLGKILQILGIKEEEVSALCLDKRSSVSENRGENIRAMDDSSGSFSKTASYQKVEVSELKPNMTLGLSVFSQEGSLVYNNGTVLDEDKILKMKQNGIEKVFIKPFA